MKKIEISGIHHVIMILLAGCEIEKDIDHPSNRNLVNGSANEEFVLYPDLKTIYES